MDHTIDRMRLRRLKGIAFRCLCYFAFSLLVVSIVLLLTDVVWRGWDYLSVDFFINPPSRFAERAGIYPAIVGSLLTVTLAICLALPLGIGTAVYINDVCRNRFLKRWYQLTVANLAAVPSIVYGLIGFVVFVQLLGMGPSVIAGACTLGLLILPVIVITSVEAFSRVPQNLKDAALALGSSRVHILRDITLPSSFPAILSGLMLAFTRAIGETAPLLIIGAASYVAFAPQSLSDSFTTLSVQIYTWTSMPQESFLNLSASVIVVLMTIVIFFSLTSALLRHFMFRQYK